MGLRDKLKRLESAADERLITFELEDGTIAKFSESTFVECMLHEYDWGGRHEAGAAPGSAHPLVEALRKARDLEAVMAERGRWMGLFVGEDAKYGGEAERPGPPVRETSTGVYE